MSPKTYTHDWRPLLGNFPSLLRGRLQPGTQFRGKLSLSKRCLLIPRAQESQKPRSQPSGSAPEIVAAVPAWPGSPTLLLAAVTGLAAIAADIFAPWGARWIVQTIDQPTHAWVVTYIPKIVRDLVFEIGISNISIVLACAGWALCTGVLLSDATDDITDGGSKEAASEQDIPGRASADLKLRAVQRLGVGWLLYVSAGGFIIPGDNLLVRLIKRAAHRTRPSTRHKSFSFPSGHTVAVTFLVGTLLFVLLPCILELTEARSKAPNAAARQGLLKNEGLQRLLKAAIERGGPLWAFTILSTAAGRVLGDVHWVTDTAAGACLGAALVSGFLLLTKQLDARTQPPGNSEQ